MAVAYDPAAMNNPNETPRETFESMMEETFASGLINRYCGICGARELRYEDEPTQFATMDEARPALASLEKANAAARSILGRAGRN
jgi:hypothetical protein